jgi:hypothetical protein
MKIVYKFRKRTIFIFNIRDPKPWQSIKRYDGPQDAHSHFNKFSEIQIPTPHVHDSVTLGGIRPAELWEIPI